MPILKLYAVNFRANVIAGHGSPIPKRGTAQISAYNLIKYTQDVFYPNKFAGEIAFHDVNPRQPVRTYNRKKKRLVLSETPVVKGIKSTIREEPEQMNLRNQGVFILVDSYRTNSIASDTEATELEVVLSDQKLHGITNGATTYATLKEILDEAEANNDVHTLENLRKAYIWVFFITNISRLDEVVQMAEGLNTSSQVQDFSIANAAGAFDGIKKAIETQPYASRVWYEEGEVIKNTEEQKDISVRDILQYLYLFNINRYTGKTHPHGVYTSSAANLRGFIKDHEELNGDERQNLLTLINHLPEILTLSDKVKHSILNIDGYKRHGETKNGRRENNAGETEFKFSGLPSDTGIVYEGAVFPVLAAFRANLKISGDKFQWEMPMEQLYDEVIDELLTVPWTQFKDGISFMDIGKRESAYRLCYDVVAKRLERYRIEEEMQRLREEVARLSK